VESPKKLKFEVVNRKDPSNQDWIRLIEEYLKYSVGKKRHLTSLARCHRFWRHERIPERILSQQAETGDLMIFRTSGSLPGLQRTFTGSDYGKKESCAIDRLDHIIMFIKYRLPY
jgi:hypothetical protein